MKRGFTLIEFLICMAVIGIISAIILPLFSQAKQAASRVDRSGRLQQLMHALHLYQNDYDGVTFPASGSYKSTWRDISKPYLASDQIAVNPAYEGKSYGPFETGKGFVLNTCIALRTYISTDNAVTFFESAPLTKGHFTNEANYSMFPDKLSVRYQYPGYSPLGGKFLADHDRGGSMYAMWDGSVKWRSLNSLRKVDVGYCENPFVPDGLFSVEYRKEK